MFHIFITLENLIRKWCTFQMALEDLLIQTVTAGGGSFVGAALYWHLQCPNHRCCQMSAVRAAVERTQEK
jgi:hypothetical protein